MPGAGFYAIHTTKLSFRSDGRWYADDDPVVHERLARLFSRYVRRKPGGGYEIWIDERYHADVEVEDTAHVVIGVNREEADRYSIELNDGTVEMLDPSTLRVGADNVLYGRAKDGEAVRFLRPAYYQLADCIEEAAAGQFVFRCGNSTYPIEPCAR